MSELKSAETSKGGGFGWLDSSVRLSVPSVSPAASVAPESSKPLTAAWLMQPSFSDVQSANHSADGPPPVNAPVSAQASGCAPAVAGNSATTPTANAAAKK